MGKKKRRYPDVDEVLSRPWCYYCERDFEDLKLLINHQKVKHFKCDACGRRLNTAGGLSVHMNQVHKETPTRVKNALPNRQGLDVEIFGMEGIPLDILKQHSDRIVANFERAQEDRFIATGNRQPNASAANPSNKPLKKIRIETPEELKQRLAMHRAKMQAIKKAGGAVPGAAAVPGQAPPPIILPGTVPPIPVPPQPYGDAPPAYPQAGGYPPDPYPPAQGYVASGPPPNLPSRPTGAPPGLPQRPYGTAAWGASQPSQPPQPQLPGDDIDQLIRMAEAGIRPSKPGAAEEQQSPVAAAATAAPAEKKSKKDKSRMVYSDADEMSPEERMANLPRYAFAAA